MRLYLVQHAKAVSKDQDPERPLTYDGRREIQKVAAFIKPLNLEVDALWHSGKKRAAQTAGLLAGAVKIRTGIIERQGLGPNDDVAALAAGLASLQQDVVIVAHLPFLGRLASLLLAGSESGTAVAFRNAGIVCLERGAGNRWRVNWMVTPELLG
jgi:phosphohistidine phosphatase